MKAKLLPLALVALCLNVGTPPANAQRRAAHAAVKTAAAAAADTVERTTATAQTPARPSQTLPIRRVILYSNGVAYIERRGTVTGHAEVDLSFKQSQVDDVLKSMVVLDLGRGRVGAVSYNSSAPPAARMADIPFSISPSTGGASGGLAGVLSQLQGARVSVTTAGGRTANGSVLTVEERRTQPEPQKPLTTTYALVIASEGGELQSFDLAEVRAVKLLDAGTRRDVGEFADASASARRRDAKTITVTSDGAGPREMLVSYTVAAPIWKTTYRVVLDAEGQPFFQGWAIVDNVSDEDWTDVQLSLISGMPVSFIQPIQKPFYRYRPVVPVPDDLRMSPQVYEPESGEVSGNRIVGSVEDPSGAVVSGADVTVRNDATGQSYTTHTNDTGIFRTPELAPGNYTVTVSLAGFKQMNVTGVNVGAARPASIGITLEVANVSETVTVTAADAPAARTNYLNNLPMNGRRGVNNFAVDGGAEADRFTNKPEPSLSARMTSSDSGIVTAAEGGEVGDLFEYKIEQPVTVRRDRSALIPILQTRMEGSRVSVFNQSAGRSRPMSGLFLKNTSPLTLEGGAITVIDGDAYAGEALLERLKPDEKRLISFALDLGTLVTVRAEEDNSPAFYARIAGGTLYATHHHREKKVYTLRNQTAHPRTVFVEHPVRDDWELDDKLTPKPDGKSQRFYRFKVELAPNETRDLVVVEREQGTESYALSNITPDQIQFFFTSRYIDDATRAALQNILDLKARLAAAQTRLSAIDREIAEIGADQKRLRENIEALTKTAEARQLIARYVQKADQQETRLEQLAKEKQAASDERARLQTQLDAALRALAFERDLASNSSRQ
ncbi:MAG: carboxypeptidase regulatory-like domain-containing protein [Pyrinomonadaceae bacterium]